MINPRPVRRKLLNRVVVKLTIIYTLAFLIFFVTSFVISSQGTIGYVTAGTSLGCLVAAIFYACRIRSSSLNALIYSAAPKIMIPLWFNNPDPEVFGRFVSQLNEEIAARQAEAKKEILAMQSGASNLPSELEKLKELFDRGILDQSQFEAAKNKLTGNEDGRRIGF